jgi:hypothetical protein
MRRRMSGWFFTITGFLACPCHLVITLPLAVALLSGTALGGWMATHEGAITIGASIYFVGALVIGVTLLLAHGGAVARQIPPDRTQRWGSACCLPAESPDKPCGNAAMDSKTVLSTKQNRGHTHPMNRASSSVPGQRVAAGRAKHSAPIAKGK